MRLQVARRQADDQPADMPGAHRRQFCRDEVEMPVRRKRSARVELAERAFPKEVFGKKSNLFHSLKCPWKVR
jgi:hypothetical protein